MNLLARLLGRPPRQPGLRPKYVSRGVPVYRCEKCGAEFCDDRAAEDVVIEGEIRIHRCTKVEWGRAVRAMEVDA